MEFNNWEELYYLGRAAQLVLDLEADICCMEQLSILSEVLREDGEEATKDLIIAGEVFKELLEQPESELDF